MVDHNLEKDFPDQTCPIIVELFLLSLFFGQGNAV